jgi:hypothetical protein
MCHFIVPSRPLLPLCSFEFLQKELWDTWSCRPCPWLHWHPTLHPGDRLYSEEELPPEFKLFLPIAKA